MSTLAGNYTALGAFDTATSFSTKVITATEPTGSYVVGAANNGPLGADLVEFVPILKDANNENCHIQVTAWNKINVPTDPAYNLWVPTTLLTVLAQAGNNSGAAYVASTFLADTITFVNGDGDVKIVSPVNDTPGYVVLDVSGAQKIEFDFDCDAGGSQAAGASVLYRFISSRY